VNRIVAIMPNPKRNPWTAKCLSL